jgi:hypothetical protein
MHESAGVVEVEGLVVLCDVEAGVVARKFGGGWKGLLEEHHLHHRRQ